MNSDLVRLLLEAGRGSREAYERIAVAATSTEFYSAAAGVVGTSTIELEVRLLATSLLKSHLQSELCSGNRDVQNALLSGLADPIDEICKAVARVVSEGVRLQRWPLSISNAILQKVIADGSFVRGGVRCLRQLLEDNIEALDTEECVASMANTLTPLVANAADVHTQQEALLAVRVILEHAATSPHGRCNAVMRLMGAPLVSQAIALVRSPANNAILLSAVRVLVLSFLFEDVMVAQFETIAPMMLQVAMSTTTEPIKTAAVEFWQAALGFPILSQRMRPGMPQLLPLLLSSMVYSEMEVAMLQAGANDGGEPDRPDEIRPRVFSGRRRGAMGEPDGEEDASGVEEWNLRRVSALTLDEMSQHFGDSILPAVLGTIDSMMQPSASWKELEAGVLALGAIAEGCDVGLGPFHASIVPRLLALLEAPETHFLVRVTTCWTLRQYGSYLILPEQHASLRRFLSCLLRCMESHSKIVQESATVNLGEVAKVAAEERAFVQSLSEIVGTITQCFRLYQLKNRLTLLETLETISRSCGSHLAEESVFQPLMTALMEIWRGTFNDSPLLCQLFTCMGAVCSAVGEAIGPVGEELFSRASQCVTSHLCCRAHGETDGFAEPDYLITSFDLLSGLFDALGSTMERWVQPRQPQWNQQVLTALHDPNPCIRQSACAVLSDMAAGCPRQLQPQLDVFVDAIQHNLIVSDESATGARSNAAWAVSKLMTHCTSDGSFLLQTQRLDLLFTSLVGVLNQPHTVEMRTMVVNVCIAVSDILAADANVMKRTGVNVTQMSETFCVYLRNDRESRKKVQVVLTLATLWCADPTPLLQNMQAFFDLAISFGQYPPTEVRQRLQECLSGLKRMLGEENWRRTIESYRREPARQLQLIYGVA